MKGKFDMTLYEQLKAGTSADDIAAAFAAELNAAQDKIKAEEAEKAAAKAEAEKLVAVKREDAVALIRLAVKFLCTHYPDLYGAFGEEDLTEDELNALADLTIMLLDFEALKPAKRSLKVKSYVAPTADVTEDDECTETVPRAVRKQKIDEACDPFTSFFKTFGL